MADPKPDHADPSINEKLADQIQREWLFFIKRLPENTIARLGAVKFTLLVLQLLLIISNHVYHLGIWAVFVRFSTSHRNNFNQAVYHRTSGGLDFTKIASLHLWRGFVVPSLFGCSAYVITALLCLRHELYHWKPELLEHYGRVVSESRFGFLIPKRWLDFCFQVYKQKHEEHRSNTIQPADRKHDALRDTVEFRRVLRQVGINLLVSVPAIFTMWMALLQTEIETQHILELPRSYVPPVQGVVWYLINDMFYFYPHWIAHSSSLVASGPSPSNNNNIKLPLPRPVLRFLHKQFKESHRLHHRCKANIGVAAWYCSVWEQILFNLFPALVGPVITQILADLFGLSPTWGTHLVTLYVWIAAAAASSVLAHTGYRSMWNDPGQHDLHHERAFDPKAACNFGTFGVFDWIHGTKSQVPAKDAAAWRGQRDRQAALWEAAERSGVPLTESQKAVVKQPVHDGKEWVRKDV
ncbi:hypothetical protein B0H63DRAFT_450281 [Podospora didyma]|uniref:Fatty acid hydroxylase domain-containing protein n=1 Tax=Podospora didyma TaxID=330526 RepID=A0AAE0NGA4_9PEZI|nr:hypothetical protein B0H63DRAFT_450281 [Podospora didyma]